MQPQFRVRAAMRALNAGETSHARRFHLVRGLAWAFLDQEKGARSKRAKRTEKARFAGCVVLGKRAHSALQRVIEGGNQFRRNDIQTLKAFVAAGGINGLLNGPSLGSLVEEFQDQEQYTHHVYRIVQYLCRAETNNLPKNQRTLTAARKFVAAPEPERAFNSARNRIAFSSSTVDQAWERFAPGAALIFGAYAYWPTLSAECDLATIKAGVRELSKKPQEVHKFLGYVAYAAAAISRTGTTKAFAKSFRELTPLQPELKEFSDAELNAIKNMKTEPHRVLNVRS